MAAVPPQAEPRRPRRGSVERPVNGRLYRGTWLLVSLPMLVAAFSVTRPAALPAPTLPPAFDRATAVQLTRQLAGLYPNRFPGTPGAVKAAAWFSRQLAPYGYRTTSDRFSSLVPGLGRLQLENVLAVQPGLSSSAILVLAHRDDAGTGPGANDNASGTAALVELARAFATPRGVGTHARASPAHTILFLSTDGGTFGALGAERFATHSGYRGRVVAAIDLDALAGSAVPRLEIAGDEPHTPSARLVATAAARILEQAGQEPTRPSALRQLFDLAFPFGLYDQAPLIAHRIPAVTLTTGADRPPHATAELGSPVDGLRLGQLGRAAEQLVRSLDNQLELVAGTAPFVFLGNRAIPGWAVQLVLVAALLPFLAVAVDLFALCRRRRIPLMPALLSLRTRIFFWLFIGGVFAVLNWSGAWPGGAARPLRPASHAAGTWPLAGLAALGLVALLGWIVARHRLVPRQVVTGEDELAGHAVAQLALAVLALLIVATNAFALLLLLPSLHAWPWLAQTRDRPVSARLATLLAGCVGLAVLLLLFATRYGLGFDAPWYLAELVAVGYVPWTSVVLFLGWLGILAQLAALTGGRYAPYPSAAERPPRGPIRETVRFLVLTTRARRTERDGERSATG